MAPLEQPQVADRSDLSQRLDMPQVDLPPEESSVNLTQLVPELDLLGDKGKEKKDDSDEEEVRVEKGSLKSSNTLRCSLLTLLIFITHFVSLTKKD